MSPNEQRTLGVLGFDLALGVITWLAGEWIRRADEELGGGEQASLERRASDRELAQRSHVARSAHVDFPRGAHADVVAPRPALASRARATPSCTAPRDPGRIAAARARAELDELLRSTSL